MAIIEALASRVRIAGELLQFFCQHRWWWLTPMVVALLLFVLLVVFAQTSAVAPLIYTLF